MSTGRALISLEQTALMHRWSGRIIWLVTTAHVVTWTYQLFIDKDPFGRPVFYGAWIYWRFKMGAVAYVFLCLVVAMSFNPLRKRFYEVRRLHPSSYSCWPC